MAVAQSPAEPSPGNAQPGLSPDRSRTLRVLENLLAASAGALFLVYSLSLVFNVGVCCADDAVFAIVAKNLANGIGYATSIQPHGHDYRIVPFDADISTGPPVILPAAALIKVFGNRYWVPGLAVVLLWSVPLLLAWWLVRRRILPGRLLLGTLVFLACCASLFSFHLEHWFALLGEVPAACLLLLAALLLGDSRDSHVSVALSAAALGLAIATKLLSAVYLPAFAAALLLSYLRRGPRIRPARAASIAVASLMAPLALIEAWKMLALGWHGYVSSVGSMFRFVAQFAVQVPTETSWAGRIALRGSSFAEHFGSAALAGVLAALALGLWFGLRERGSYGRSLTFLAAGGLIHLGYWFFFSIGWPRYFLIGAFVVSAVLALVVFLGTRSDAVAAACLAAVLVVTNWNGLRSGGNFGTWPGAPHGPTRLLSSGAPSRVAAMKGAVAYILERRGTRPLAAQWFAPVADLEYLLPQAGNFQHYTRVLRRCEVEGCLVPENLRFHAKIEDYDAFLDRCGPPGYASDVYVVYDCPPLHEAR